jgi:ATP-dependent DNA ligase
MLATLTRELPVGTGLVYEPKWDGFRCLARRDGDDVELRSRSGRPLARYFPEIVEALRALPERAFVVDGELVARRNGRADFAALMGRLHPAASRVARLSHETPATYIVFDLLGLGDRDMLGAPFGERRAGLERLVGGAPPPIQLSNVTTDAGVAQRWLDAPVRDGVDGVMVKRLDAPYEPGRRRLLKVRHERTADCVLAGFRLYADEPAVGSLLLGLYDHRDGTLQHVGVVTSFTMARRRELLRDLAPGAIDLAAHPWRDGYALEGGPMGRLRGAAGRWTPSMGLDWVPLPPDRVIEVAYEQLDGHRFRHPARFRRWRPDRDPRSCTLDQLEEAA